MYSEEGRDLLESDETSFVLWINVFLLEKSGEIVVINMISILYIYICYIKQHVFQLDMIFGCV